MFTSQLPDDEDYRVYFSDYANRHFVKRFAKDYKGKRWLVTHDSIYQDLKRVHAIARTQQVDELKSGEGCLLFKYDFAVAQTNISPKSSGNRCVVFLGVQKKRADVLLVFGKGDLPKNKGETQYILDTISAEFRELFDKLN
jgi:hypothetical protein